MVWDYTCVDIFAGVHLNWSAMEAGICANYAEEHKGRKYAALVELHQFEPIVVQTMGVYGGSIGVIMRALIDRRLVEVTFEPGWAIAVHQGNAFSILSAGWERF